MKKIIWKLLWLFLGLFILGTISVISVIAYFSFTLPKISSLADYRPALPSQILSADGTILAEIGTQKRETAELDEIPKIIIDAFLSAEDDSFYQHKGVVYGGMLRAFFANLRSGKVVQGGSTITQQIAKSLLLSSERSYARKIKDILLAQRIEKRFSKDEILFLYLNQVYLGGGFYGVKAAFRGYFGKELSEATIAESAMIAGLLVAPGRYSPYINPEFSKTRQKYVLKRMHSNNKISQEEYASALKEVIKFSTRDKNLFKAGYFTEWVRQRVSELVGEDKFLTDGFTVKTTLDYQLQIAAEKYVMEGAKDIDKRQGFRGPLGHINLDNELKHFEVDFRKKLLLEKSHFFTIDDGFQKRYELEYDSMEYAKLKEYQNQWISSMDSGKILPGNWSNDSFVKHLERNTDYQAVVLSVSDQERIIYVSLGGVVGIIPYTHFRWAHERSISEEHKFFPYVTRPSNIVKPGDILLVTIQDHSVSIWEHLFQNFSKKFLKPGDIIKIKGQQYLLCMLEQEPEVQAALVSVLPATGEIKAFVGGTNFEKSQYNRVIQSQRQPGSSFKPVLYAAALENGFTPASIIIDSPEALGGVDGLNWKPRNYDGNFLGPITFRNSLERSRNVPTIKIAEKIGVPTVLDFVDRLGFNATLDQDLSLALGSFGVSLIDITSTYAIFPNGGRILDIRSVESVRDREGNIFHLEEGKKRRRTIIAGDKKEAQMVKIDEAEGSKVDRDDLMTNNSGLNFISNPGEINPYHVTLDDEQVYDQRLAYIMTNLLRGIVNNPGGTGYSAKVVGNFLGGKTGTTNNYVDAWFIGFSTGLVTGVWTGFDDNQTMGWAETGAKAALPIWKNFMTVGIEKYGEQDYKVPPGIIHVLINKDTAELVRDGEANAFLESFVEGTEPGRELPDSENKVIMEDNILEDDEYYNNQ